MFAEVGLAWTDGDLDLRFAVLALSDRRIRRVLRGRGLHDLFGLEVLKGLNPYSAKIGSDAENAGRGQQDRNDEPLDRASEKARRSGGHGPILADG